MFVDPAAPAGDPAHELSGAPAYALLLEIICGLHSPVVGETQVLGQFRSFLATPEAGAALWLTSVGDQLIHDARLVRERHLRGVSSGSYGGEVRRRLGGVDVVALVGAGSLASELRPYVCDVTSRLDQWRRQDVSGAGARGVTAGAAAIVVAAPVSDDDIARVAACYADLRLVVDLRAARERGPVCPAPVVTLDDLFASIQASAAVSAERVACARALIADLAADFAVRAHVRPFGWEDLCA